MTTWRKARSSGTPFIPNAHRCFSPKRTTITRWLIFNRYCNLTLPKAQARSRRAPISSTSWPMIRNFGSSTSGKRLRRVSTSERWPSWTWRLTSDLNRTTCQCWSICRLTTRGCSSSWDTRSTNSQNMSIYRVGTYVATPTGEQTPTPMKLYLPYRARSTRSTQSMTSRSS